MCNAATASKSIGGATTIGGLAYGNESPESIKQNIDSHLGQLLVGQEAANINAAMLRLDKAAKGNTFAKSGVERIARCSGQASWSTGQRAARRSGTRQSGSGLDPGQRQYR